MNYPLKWHHQFVRETECFFLGHKLVRSKSKHTQYYGLTDEEVPYSVRKITGNYMFESVAWWSVKCTRCRYKHRVDEGDYVDIWYKRQYWAMRDALRTMKWHINSYSADWTKQPIPFKLRLLGIPVVLVTGLKQYLMHFDRLPYTWWTGLADIEYWYWEKIDEK